jgi:7,8-dihydropterin-6-yl-methyl-4-(beta-D-ribofuranosyl)aminobenzene 5'-phosphate synthase
MKIKVLADNNTIIDRYYLGEPGLSFLVEADGEKILFDMGYSDVFIKNAFKMGETLRDIDKVVFSHGHMDHTWGLDPYIRILSECETEKLEYTRPSLVAHEELFLTRRFEEFNEIGSLVSEEKAARHFDMELTNKPVKLTDNLWFLGEIERKHDFEGKMAIGEVLRDGAWEPDLVTDDTAMAYAADGGIVVVTGCSHAGICNIIEQAKKVTGIEKIVGVIGGFHLMDGESRQVVETGKYFKRNEIEEVYACHCTCLAAKIKLAQYTNVTEIGSGLTLKEWM